MDQLETFSTAGLPPQRRLEFWNDLACNTFTPIVADPTDVKRFAPMLTRTSIGDIRVALVRSDPSIVYHSSAHVARTKERQFFLHLQFSGRSINLQDGREARLEPGDFTLFDNSRPYQMIFEASNDVLVLCIPEKTLRRHMACPDDVVAIPMSYRENLNRMLADFGRGLWRQCEEGVSSTVGPFLSRALLELTASAYSTIPQACTSRSSLAGARRMRILSYIEQHLVEHDLTPSRIAAAMNVTPRYLHLLFADGNETVGRYILRRRLEECARVLASDRSGARTVSEIAFDFGFSSLTHFGKVFREKYGVSPTEYRRQYRLKNSNPASLEARPVV